MAEYFDLTSKNLVKEIAVSQIFVVKSSVFLVLAHKAIDLNQLTDLSVILRIILIITNILRKRPTSPCLNNEWILKDVDT